MIPLALLLAAPVQAADAIEYPTHEVRRLDHQVAPPVIDGVLDDDAWALCTPLSPLRQVVPVAGAPASERTEVLLAFDEDHLYVGLRCFDSDPSRIRATQMARDANLDPDDRVELLFDTFHDRRNAFWFQIGAAGSLGDALITRNGAKFNKRWDTIWEGRAEVTAEGWFAELSIPLASINFDPETDHWGFNVRRHIRRHTEEVRWAGPEPRLFFFGAANAGTLTGLQGLRQGSGLDLVPYVAGGLADEDQGATGDLDAGLDVYYRVSPNTKLSLSFNTDFAETEVDDRRVNLTRFPLFFPEKRKFFLEDSGVFEFGTSNDVVPFFSRRIGIDDQGDTVPLLANAKLTSTTEGYSYGILDSLTGDSDGLASRNLFAGRFSKNVLDQSDVGVIFTQGDPTGDEDSYTVGADLNLRTDKFLGDRNLRFSSYLLKTEDPQNPGDDLAYQAQVSYPNDEVQLSSSYTVVEENFRPALGFVRRTGIRDWSSSFEYRPRLYSEIRRLRFEVSPRWVTDSSGRTQSISASTIPFGIEWESGEVLRLRATPREETLDSDFEISDGVTIPAGTYDDFRYGVSFDTSDRRPLSAELDFTTGTFFDGTREDYGLELQWRASVHAIFGLDYTYNDLHLAGGEFDVHVVRAKADVVFSPFVTLSNFVQWDDTSHDLGLNSRLRYIFEPGRDLFFVVNQGWNTIDSGFAPTGTDLRFKVAYNIRI
jgi:hypothetical protein